MSWLGRGYESVPGKPFGWAWHEERREIAAHLQRRGFAAGEAYRLALIVSRVSRIQDRLHRNKPTYRERSAAFAAKAGSAPSVRDEAVTALRAIASGHNDPRALAAEVLARLGLDA